MDKKCGALMLKSKRNFCKKTLPSSSDRIFLGQNFLHLFVGTKLFISVVCSWRLLELQVCLPLKTSVFPWKWSTYLVCSNEMDFEREFM